MAIKQLPLAQSGRQPPALEVGDGLRPAVPAYGAIAVKAAEQDAPALRTRLAQGRQHPTEIGRITHRSFQRDEEALELGEIVATVVFDIGDVDIADHARNCLDVRCLVGVVTGWYRTVKTAPRHAGKSRKPAVLSRPRAGSERRHRGRIEAATEQASDRMGAAHLPAYRDIEAFAQTLG